MDLNVIEFAAWIFIGKTVWEFVFRRIEEKRRLIQCKAAMAEYQDTVSAESIAQRNRIEIDENQPEWKQRKERQQRERERELNLERQRQLLMRYPGLLVPLPAGRYFKQAEEEASADRQPFKQRLKDNWKWWLLAVVMLFVGYLINLGLRAAWAIFMGSLH